MGIRIIKTDKPLSDPEVLAIRHRLREGALLAAQAAEVNVPAAVSEIIADVRGRGDAAVIDWERKLDGAELAPQALRVPAERIAEAQAATGKRLMALLRRAAANIRRYQERILPKPPRPMKRGGRELSLRYTPIERVGVYVPGGRAVYPSTVLMTVVPAQVAGVREIAIASPPTADGDVNEIVLAIAGELGIDEVYRIGGAVAVAALACGTESVKAVDKIVGPGNVFVAEAKRQVFGRVGIDSIAGPSEVLIIADETAEAEHLAADMLAQAEHDPGSAVLVTPSEKLAGAVAAAVEQQLPQLERAEAIRTALDKYSAIIVTPDINAACDLANDFAPEHLQIITADDEAALAKVRNAGAIFLGPDTPVPLGDYYAGPSHVLPTGGTARFFSALSCNDFLKATSVVRYDAASLAKDSRDVINFARREGLTAHARAVEIRSKPKPQQE
ncbi:MAG: histidinol dehydrogenase [Planctomycetota bacterium]|jgi:histidinol dehydrogenase